MERQASIKTAGGGEEEEKLDQVVKLEDIMNDIYKMKFHSKKKRSHMEDDEPSEKASQSEKSSQMTYRSKSFNKDGDEVFSEDSYLFQWKPDYIAR